jgi:hypothetical protein
MSTVGVDPRGPGSHLPSAVQRPWTSPQGYAPRSPVRAGELAVVPARANAPALRSTVKCPSVPPARTRQPHVRASRPGARSCRSRPALRSAPRRRRPRRAPRCSPRARRARPHARSVPARCMSTRRGAARGTAPRPRTRLHSRLARRFGPLRGPTGLVGYGACGAISLPCSSSPSAPAAARARTRRRRGKWSCSCSSRSCWPPPSTTGRPTPRSARRGSCARAGCGGRASSRCPAAGRGDDRIHRPGPAPAVTAVAAGG